MCSLSPARITSLTPPHPHAPSTSHDSYTDTTMHDTQQRAHTRARLALRDAPRRRRRKRKGRKNDERDERKTRAVSQHELTQRLILRAPTPRSHIAAAPASSSSYCHRVARSLALALSSSMGPKPRRPAHQNKVAFHHNKNSKKTKVILSLPNEGLCRKCHEVIEWKKAYRKYKPLTQPKKWCEQQPLHLLLSNPVASMEGGSPPRSVIQFDRSRELTAASAFARSFVVVCRAADGRYAVRITYSVTRVPRRISRAASASPRHRSLRTSRAARLSLCMCLCAHFQVCHFPSVGKRSRRRNDRSERWPRSSC